MAYKAKYDTARICTVQHHFSRLHRTAYPILETGFVNSSIIYVVCSVQYSKLLWGRWGTSPVHEPTQFYRVDA